MLEFNAYKIFRELYLAYLYMPGLMLAVAVRGYHFQVPSLMLIVALEVFVWFIRAGSFDADSISRHLSMLCWP